MRLRAAAVLLSMALACAAESGIWLDVPFVPQEKNGCGSASLAMIMKYWGREPDTAGIQRLLYSERLRGIKAADMRDYLAAQGFQAFTVRGTWDFLKDQLEKGRPLIVCLREPGARDLHYVVAAGVDWRRGLLLVNDPARRKLLKLDRGRFERSWVDGWTLIAVPSQAK